MAKKIILADTETATLGDRTEPVEIAFLELDEDLEIIDEFSSLVKPTIPIDPESSSAHHLVDDDVKDCLSVDEVLRERFQPGYFDDVLLIGHKSSYDAGVMAPWWNVTEQLCTLRAARHYWPDAPSHKLQVLRYWLKLPVKGGAHRAMDDVLTTYELLLRISEIAGVDTLEELIAEVKKPLVITKMWLGKYRGERVEDVPKGYVGWALRNLELDDDQRRCLEGLLK